MIVRLLILFFFFALGACQKNSNDEGSSFEFSQGQGFSCKAGELGPKAIYGSDDRLDWIDSPGITKDYWARATVALMPSIYLMDEGETYKVEAESYGEAVNLCPGEKFSSQPSAAFCSGFLVAPDLVVTAGHCVRSQSDCMNTQFVFGFAKTERDQVDYRIKKKDVYACDEVVTRSVGNKDYALIKLDRMVAGRTPLNIRRQGQVQVGEKLMIIGHPMGIPSKIAEGGSVMSNNDRIRASVDAFAANSGSVILNMRTGDVEGILVAGEADFVFQNGCRVEYRCGSNCRGEVITPISDLADFIPDVIYDNPVCPSN